MSAPRLFGLLISLVLVGCGQEIGDACETALDCSSQGSRLCDRTQPHGYCTLRGCERGTCPEESVCVKFRPEQERLAVTFCMYGCEEDDDCRNDEGYQCVRADAFGARGEAEILGSSSQRFCVARPREPVDAGVLMSVMPEPSERSDSSTGSSDAASSVGDAAGNDDAATGATDAATDAAASGDAASASDGG